MNRVALSLAAASLLACQTTSDRGRLAVVAIRDPGISFEIIRRDVEGRACGYMPEIEKAIANAIARVPNADALIDISLQRNLGCFVARGTAIRILPKTSP